MKFDRFVKIMLLVIAVLLLLNCVKDFTQFNPNSNSAKSTSTPFLEIPVKASVPPAFIQEGKFYTFSIVTMDEMALRIKNKAKFLK